jgi:hypothetical protein
MAMKVSRVGIFIMAIVSVVAAMVATSCVAIDEFAPKQRSQIESYLGNKEYRVTSDSAYVHLAGNKFNVEPQQRPAGAAKGDKVTFNVEAYIFSASSPKDLPYYTNKRYLAERLSENLNTEYWDFEPKEAILGAGDVINPLEEAFEGSIAGDSLLVFLTSSIAYGSEGMGAVPKDTPVMMILTVEELATK